MTRVLIKLPLLWKSASGWANVQRALRGASGFSIARRAPVWYCSLSSNG